MPDLRQLIKLPQPPYFTRVLRPPPFPQMEMGHLQLLAWRDRLEREQPGLHLCGFGWEGIGMNDMIKKAKAVAKDVGLGRSAAEQAAVKGVYF